MVDLFLFCHQLRMVTTMAMMTTIIVILIEGLLFDCWVTHLLSHELAMLLVTEMIHDQQCSLPPTLEFNVQ
jgi:hypothetical protein